MENQMNKLLAGKVAIVTGGAEGARVVIADVAREKEGEQA